MCLAMLVNTQALLKRNNRMAFCTGDLGLNNQIKSQNCTVGH